MLFKKNYFVEFEYEGKEGKAIGSATIRCLPSMVPRISEELKNIMISNGYKGNNVFVTNIKRV